MKFQLHRVLLINAGSNKSIPSARLTEIDPRDGAAVLGANGVGKTTVLQIIPLFFGHQPSQIIGAGQQSMVSFLLPTDGSAIGFEFQRGADSPENMRLVVMRRRSDDPDHGFYRIFTGPFHRDLFVQDGRFVNDEESIKRAGELGIKHTKMLTISEYRNVILRTTALSKDRDKLRLLAYEHSFGPRPLANLDRLVAAMVKPAINFEDILQVVVSMVHRDMGAGVEGARITFKQPPSLIKRWLSNRLACIEADRIRPNMLALEDDLTEHRHAESRFRARRADVNAVVQARNEEHGALTTEIAEMDRHRTAVFDERRIQRQGHVEACAVAQKTVITAELAHSAAQAEADAYEAQGAESWSNRMVEIGGHRDNERSIKQQITAAQAGQAEAAETYRRLEQAAISDAEGRRLALLNGKPPIADKLREDLDKLLESEKDANAIADAAYEEVRQHCRTAIEPLLIGQGQWAAHKAQPVVSVATSQAIEQAVAKLSTHKDNVALAQAVATKAKETAATARRDLNEQEGVLTKVKSALLSAEAAVVAAKARLTPPDGSLLAALRENDNESWKRNLAKIVRQDLLDRVDLNPAFLKGESPWHAFGWSLNTSAIDSPDWVDDQRTKDALSAAEEKAGTAKATLESVLSVREAKGKADHEAEKAFQVEEAKLTVLQRQTEGLKTALDAARQVADAEVRNGADNAERELQNLRGQISDLKNQEQKAKAKAETDRAGVKLLHNRQRIDAKASHDEAMCAIDALIKGVDKDLTQRIGDIRRQQAEHLSAQGIDVEKLNGLEALLLKSSAQIRALEEKQTLVERWKEWQGRGGLVHVEGLHTALRRAVDHARDQVEKKNEFESQSATEMKNLNADFEAKNKRLGVVNNDVENLRHLDHEFGDYQAVGESMIDLDTSAAELKGMTKAEHAELEKLESKIARSFRNQRNVLTAGDSAVGELIEASLSLKGTGTIEMAADLCTTYKQIGPQVVSNLNNTLETILSNVNQFQKSIRAFESEVHTFNVKLQKGLSAVHKFERISDITLVIKTNFESLNFYKKFSAMENVIRDNNNVTDKNNNTYIHPNSIAIALGEFANVLDKGGDVDINLSRFISLQGTVTENERTKEFRNAAEFSNISSSGLTALVGITVMTALLNTIRGDDPIYVPWVTDEIGKYDVGNLGNLVAMLCENKIDVITAAPELTHEKLPFFARRYLIEDKGRIRKYVQPDAVVVPTVVEGASA